MTDATIHPEGNAMFSQPYRLRTWCRAHLPAALGRLFPPGRDCGPGRHEWVAASPVGERWMCIHCVQETDENPFAPGEWARLRALALLEQASIVLRSSRSDEDAAEEAGPIIVSALTTLPAPELAERVATDALASAMFQMPAIPQVVRVPDLGNLQRRLDAIDTRALGDVSALLVALEASVEKLRSSEPVEPARPTDVSAE